MASLPSRLGRRPVHSQDEIISAACDLFARNGYYKTSIQDIADAAGVTKGGIYHYLDSKEQALYLIHNRFIVEGLRRITVVAAGDLAPLEKLQRLIEVHVGILHDFHREIRLFFQEMHVLTGTKRDEVVSLRDRYADIFEQVIRECAEAGVIRADEPGITARFILGAGNWMYTWYRPGGRLKPSQVAYLLRTMVLEGLAYSTASRPPGDSEASDTNRAGQDAGPPPRSATTNGRRSLPPVRRHGPGRR